MNDANNASVTTCAQIATNGIRTHDLPLTKRVLCQLSYSGWNAFWGQTFGSAQKG